MTSSFAATVSDSNLGYSITLPANWTQLKLKPDQHYFRDTARTYKGQISILRYAIDKVTYPTPETWSEAQFIAYKLSVEHSAYPFGAVVYYDSSAAAKIGARWAPEAFSVLYPADGDPTYCEYIRYVANGDYGYEIYAIGDSTDMTNQVDFYAGIIATTQLSEPLASLAGSRNRSQTSKATAASVTNPLPIEEFDFLGRELRADRTRKPAGMLRPYSGR